MVINEIITKDEMTWYLNKINALKQYGCEWRTARRICMLILGPKGFKSCCTFGVLYPIEGNLSIYSQFWVKSLKIPALLDCTNSNGYVGGSTHHKEGNALYCTHCKRGDWSSYWPGKNILVFTVKNKDFFIHIINVDKTSCH